VKYQERAFVVAMLWFRCLKIVDQLVPMIVSADKASKKLVINVMMFI
jgi:hypothetical protein